MARFSPQPIEGRFWAKVAKGHSNECWEWIGAKTSKGYGTIRDQGRTRRATHVAWEFANGRPIPEGMMVCHSCDSPPCVNPDHLWVGTGSDNIKDCYAKGRFPLKVWTHCKRGHLLTEKRNWRGVRRCGICERKRRRLRYHEKRLRQGAK